ncbi:hypothetical protein [Methylobacterium sp. WSM2598]|uniref:hypothetical protein n=1 Tax=Methylobacterium sp. WSM2598 TaxID=398261 RepID=UPI00037ED7FA|nr:hypothetical protein [Methylobacterium sp. WSM2598]
MSEFSRIKETVDRVLVSSQSDEVTRMLATALRQMADIVEHQSWRIATLEEANRETERRLSPRDDGEPPVP